jgi:hypothetical protein
MGLSFPCSGLAQDRPQEHRGGARAPSLLWAPERAEEYGTALWQVRRNEEEWQGL